VARVLAMILALAGGVGAARMLGGLSSVISPSGITAVVNTGDDVVLHGLHISPDLDTVTYTLSGMINPDTGWGLRDESWAAMAELRAYSSGRLGWFNLGDRDLGTHLYRTTRLLEGATLSTVATEIANRWGVGVRILPMSDDRVETRVVVQGPGGGQEIGFQEYFVGRQHGVPVSSIRFEGVHQASAAPGVLDAIAAADRIVICPSNPIVSIGPVLATGGIGSAVERVRDKVVAVSPIIAGRALKGPADRMMSELGHTSSVVGVAGLWAGYAESLVIDEADAHLAPQVEAAGMRAVITPTVMSDRETAASLARVVLDTPFGRR
jgi:LPPG:FO 2-phospho-L-lactate transferase